MRLLILCNDYNYFMAHRHDLFSHLPGKGVDVTAYCGAMPAERVAAAFPIRAYACDRYRFRPFLDLLLFLQILGLLMRHRPDVVHTITLKPNLIGGLAVRLLNLFSGKPCRLVMMTAGLGRVFNASGPHESRGVRERLVMAGLRSALSPAYAHAVFENDADRKYWESHGLVEPSRAHLVQGTGVDPAVFRRRASRAAVPPLKVLFASRLLKSKGIEFFIELARDAATQALPVRFLAAGGSDASDSDGVDLNRRTLPDNLEYLGHCRDMPALLAGVHAVILPSVYAEGLPRILLEAAAMGCVLIASDIPGCRRIVEDGVNGFLLPVEDGKVDMTAARKALQRLAGDSDCVSRMGKAAGHAFETGGFDIASVRAHFASILFSGLPERPHTGRQLRP